MNTDGDRLREVLRERTPQPPRPIDIDDVAARLVRPARAPIPMRRLSPLAAVAVIAAVVVLVVALQRGSHGKPAPTHPASPHPVPTSAPTHPPTVTHAPSRPVQPPAGEGIVYSTDVYSADFAVVVVGPGPDGKGRNRLLATTDWGRTFTDIGPRISSAWSPNSLFILDRQHIWFSAYNGGTIGVDVYRTSDGGRHWQNTAAGAHSAAGFSAIDFVDTSDGFLLDVSPNGPAGDLWASHDGGASWSVVADIQARQLPAFAAMHFLTADTGWVSGYYGEFYRTDDGGRHWTSDAPPGVGSGQGAAPVVAGSILIDAYMGATSDRYVLHVLKQPESGGTWKQFTTLDIGPRDPGSAGVPSPPSVSFPALTDGWAAGLDDGLVVVYRWDGSRWTRVSAPYGRTLLQPHIHAIDAQHAWLSFTQDNNTIEESNSEVYRTSDGGRSWQRIDLAALATK